MNNVEIMTTERLNKLIADTQETLSELKQEVERREVVQQNQEIENLDVHMEAAEVSLKTIKDFISMLLSERKN